MADNIPYATPYPWDSPTVEELQKYANDGLRKKPFVGSGFAALRKNAFGPNSSMGNEAKKLLVVLLQQNNADVGNTGDFDNVADQNYAATLQKLDRDLAQDGLSDKDLLAAAREGRLSLFMSILRLFDDPEARVTTKDVLRSSCLTLRPGDVPGSIDAKEMIMAALHFLSSNFEAKSDEFLSLPLLRSVQEVSDLEKRTYQKDGDWNLSEDKEKLLRLEQIFVSSPSQWKWLKRESLCPRLPHKDEIAFFLKGAIPASASAKKAKGEWSRKRKATSSAPPSESASITNEAMVDDSSMPVAEAEVVDSMPEVEATIVAESSPSYSHSMGD